MFQGRFPEHGTLFMLEIHSMSDLESFFNELKEQYSKERQNFPWSWDDIGKEPDKSTTKDFVYYIAYNLGKNIIHGPLPGHLHSRMIFDDKNMWTKRYVNFLEGR